MHGEQQHRLGMKLALCLFAAAAVSILRAVLGGGISLIDHEASLWSRAVWSFCVGLPLAAAAWLYVEGHRSAIGPLDRRLFHRAIIIQLAAALALPLTSADVFCNLAYGALSAIGLNPHSAAPAALGDAHPLFAHVATAWRNNPSPYGPVMTPFQTLAAVTRSVEGALAIFKVEMLALSIAILAIAFAYAKRFAPPAMSTTAFVTIGFSPLFAWELAGQAHNDAVIVALLFAFVFALAAEKQTLAFLALLAACCAKYVAAPVLAIYLAFRWRHDRARATLMGVVAAAAMLFAVRPYGDGPVVPESLANPTGVEHHTRSFTDLACWLLTPFGPDVVAGAYWVGWTAAIVGIAALTLRAALRAKTREAVVRESLIVLLGVCLLTPWGQPWYATWLFAFAVAHHDPRWQRLVVIYGALSVAQYVLLIDPLSYIVVSGVPAVMMWRLMRSDGLLGAPKHADSREAYSSL